MISINPLYLSNNYIFTMTNCLAITKKGTQCLNEKCKKVALGNNHTIIFCGIHIKKNPNNVLLEGTNKVISYVDIEHYLAERNKYNLQKRNKYNLQNQNKALSQEIILAREPPQKQIGEIQTICTICYNEFLNNTDLIKCSSSVRNEYNHLVCLECLKGHVSSLLSDGIASLECMFNKHEHCQGQYTEEHIKHALEYKNAQIPASMSTAKIPNQLEIGGICYSKWQEVMVASEIIKLAGICDNYIICPLCCKWGCIFEIPVGAEKYPFYIRCAGCKKEWCTLCKRGAHADRSCYELAFTDRELIDDDKMSQVIDKMIQDIATMALTHCCSICGCSYVKEEGCNLMSCPKCNCMSCFICGIKLYYKGDTKYWHFTGHDKSDPGAQCPLWNNYAGDGQENQGNTSYNIASIEKEFNKFLTSNKSNKRVFKLIQQRIVANYEKDKTFVNILKNIRN